MKRLYLTVEGQTEQAFVIQVLQPHLTQYDVFLWKPRLTGLHARRRGRIPSGGLLNTFQHSLGDIRRWLSEDKRSDARFSMMIDLYSLPRDFPGYDAAEKETDSSQRIETLEGALASELNDKRFIPYLQVHEFEAMVLSRPEAFDELFDDASDRTKQLVAECQAFSSPEQIDGGQQTHPKARIKKYFPDYDENVDGPLLLKDIGLATIRMKCPHFDRWLTVLENLGT